MANERGPEKVLKQRKYIYVYVFLLPDVCGAFSTAGLKYMENRT